MLKRPLKLGQTFTLLIHNVYIYYLYYEVELHYVEISFVNRYKSLYVYSPDLISICIVDH